MISDSLNIHLIKTMPSLQDGVVFELFLMKKVSWFFGQFLVGKMVFALVGEFRIFFCSRDRVRGQGKPSLCLFLLLVRLPALLELLPL